MERKKKEEQDKELAKVAEDRDEELMQTEGIMCQSILSFLCVCFN